jgi:hypothetical protein
MSCQAYFLIGPGDDMMRSEWELAGRRGMELLDLTPGMTVCFDPSTELLQPGAAKRYRFRVLVLNYFEVKAAVALTSLGKSREIPRGIPRQWRLVCDRPGQYVVMAGYPLLVPKESQRLLLYSNLERFRVRWPEPRSQRVWERINRWEFLGFLQSPGPWFSSYGVSAEMADLAVDMLREHPDSEYSPAIRLALRHCYAYGWDKTPSETQEESRNRRQRISEVLRLPQWAIYDIDRDVYHPMDLKGAENLFCDDRRLDREKTYSGGDFRPLEALIHEVSSDGFLGVAPALCRKYEAVLPQARIREPVRSFMKRIMPPGTTWVNDGDGYKLVPAPEDGK